MTDDHVILEIYFNQVVEIDWQAYIQYCRLQSDSVVKWMIEKIAIENPRARIEAFEYTDKSDLPLVKFVLFSSFAPHIANNITMPITFTSAYKKPPHPSE